MSDDIFADVHADMEEAKARKAEERAARLGPRARYTDPRWIARAKTFLAAHQYCLGCAGVGLTVRSTIADHVKPVRYGTEDFYSSPLQALCSWPCHGSIKRALEHQLSRGECSVDDLRADSERFKRLRGAKMPCDIDGFPTNPFHPWAKKKPSG
jgi:hypothetical protein